jgi:hypothetical protein
MPSRHEDLQRLTRIAVQRLVDDWSSRNPAHRPWGMWLMLWGAIENDEALQTLEITVPLKAAWFLTESGFVRREEWNALRYLTLRQAEIERRCFERSPGVGLFDVAPYRDHLAVYASAEYGPLNAYGFRMEFDDHGQPVAHRLWVS